MIRANYIAILCLFFLQVAKSQNQVAIDSTQLTLIDIGVRGMWQTGSFDQFNITPNFNLQILRNKHFFEADLQYQYLSVSKFAVINDLWSTLLYQYNQQNKFYPFITVAGGTAKSYLLNHFLTTGIGVGSNIYKKSFSEYIQVHAYAGYLDFQIDDFLHQALSVGSIIRANINLSQKIQLNWYYTSYHSTKQSSSWGLQNNLKLNFQVTNNLGVNLNQRLFYNHQTVSELKKLNTIFLFGINYQFKKEKQ